MMYFHLQIPRTMRRTTFITALFLFAFTAPLFGQDVETTPQDHAKWRALCYAQAVGMDEKATGKLAASFEAGELEVLELRAQVQDLEARIEAAMAPYDASVEKQLSKEQRARLAELKAKGWKACSEPCPPPTAASCAPAEGKACCAGTKATQAKPAPPAPNATLE
jgi:hypothetical protein